MKKSIYLSLLTGVALASCSQDAIEYNSPAGEGNYTITVNLPSDRMGTRALGDGLSATNLNVYLYNADDKSYIGTQTATFTSTSLSTTVTLNLINGKSYYVAFFASSPNASTVYTVDPDDAEITVNYTNMTAYNTEDYDCFFNVLTTGTVGTDTQAASITLKRPLAQINWGTDDLSASAVTPVYGTNGAYLQSSVTATVYNTFDMLAEDDETSTITGDVTGSTESISLGTLPPPSGATFPVADYSYVSSQYVLAPAASSVSDLTLTVTNNGGTNSTGTESSIITHTIPVNAAPLQANFRTNIYGSLLTNTMDITVVKNASWESPSNDIDLKWDGTTVTYPTADEDGNYYLNRASDLAGLIAMANGTDGQTQTDFDGQTIILAADFDMNNQPFAGIGTVTRSGSSVTGNSFKGVFDGNNNTIRNLVISAPSDASQAVGFIGNLDGEDAEVKDLNFEGLTINAPQATQAAVIGTLTNGAKVTNVNVKSGTVTAAQGAAGIVGRMILSGTVEQCDNYATINSGTNGGGIIGAAYYTGTDQTMTVSNCNNYGDVTGTSQGIGGVVGLSSAVITSCNNSGTITGGSTATGGIVGQQTAAGSITGCNNSGKVIGGSGYGSGGIVGWVRYTTDTTSYPAQNVISVTGCENTAAITGSTGVGGIVGVWYMCGICDTNTNSAPTISATGSFVAGIIGDQQWTGDAISGTGANASGNDMLYIRNNTSNTTWDNITGTLKALIVYINSQSNVTMSGNTPDYNTPQN